MGGPELSGGFSDPATASATAFRAVLNAMSRPGTIERVAGAHAPQPVSVAAAVTLLTLCDHETSVFLGDGFDTGPVREWISFQTGAVAGPAEKADFALGQWTDFVGRHDFPIGTPEYPDRSTTLIVEMEALEAEGARLSGPGIRDVAALSLPEVKRFAENALLFPLGLDFIFTCGDRVAALPRTTRVEAA